MGILRILIFVLVAGGVYFAIDYMVLYPKKAPAGAGFQEYFAERTGGLSKVFNPPRRPQPVEMLPKAPEGWTEQDMVEEELAELLKGMKPPTDTATVDEDAALNAIRAAVNASRVGTGKKLVRVFRKGDAFVAVHLLLISNSVMESPTSIAVRAEIDDLSASSPDRPKSVSFGRLRGIPLAVIDFDPELKLRVVRAFVGHQARLAVLTNVDDETTFDILLGLDVPGLIGLMLSPDILLGHGETKLNSMPDAEFILEDWGPPRGDAVKPTAPPLISREAEHCRQRGTVKVCASRN